MKSVLAILKKPWFISLLGVILLGLLVWFAGPYIAIAEWEPLVGVLSRIFVIVLFLFAWALYWLLKKIRAQKADQAIVEGMAEQEAPDDVGAHSAEEVELLNKKFAEAVEFLKRKDKKGKASTLYELPWYIIIGPPGSGKTTALMNAGLNFPLSERFGREALQGVGGTRNCDWWVTDEAVLIDTAGRYVTQDSHTAVDSAAWEGFLGLLKKHRGRRPINGALIAISLSDIVAQSPAERDQHIQAIKQRVQELYKNLGIRFPIYVLFTKADLIAGFMEYFDDLRQEERAQVWGMTFDKLEADAKVLNDFNAWFDELMQRLQERHLWRIENERDLQRRQKIYGFPFQMASMRDVMQQFLQGVFQATRFEEQPFLRGIYFTSGTQEGTPIDRLMGSISRRFGLGQRAIAAFGGQGRSYFITRLLRDVIFNEQGLAGLNPRVERKRRRIQAAAYVGALAATALGALAWTASYTANDTYLTDVRTPIETYRDMGMVENAAAVDFPEVAERLDIMRQALDHASQYEADTPMGMQFGLYQGDAVSQAANDAYIRELNALLMNAISRRMEEQLVNAIGDTDYRYEALKMYLMLGMRERFDSELVKIWMQIDWDNLYSDIPGLPESLSSHFAHLVDSGRMQHVMLNEELIANVRASLGQVSLAALVYERLKRDYAANDDAPFRLNDVLGSDGVRVFTSRSGRGLDIEISGLFTYRGFYERYQVESKALVKDIQQEDWVLGIDKGKSRLSRQEMDNLEESLRDLYIKDYIREWDQMLQDLDVVKIRNISQAVEVADILSSSNSPLRRLLQTVARNTALNKLPEGVPEGADEALKEASKRTVEQSRYSRLITAGKKVLDKRATKPPGDAVHQHFLRLNKLSEASSGSPPIDRVINLLSELNGYFYSIQEDVGSRSIAAISSQGEGAALLKKLRTESSRYPQPVKRWLKLIGGGSRNVAVGGARSQLAKMWSENVAPLCRKSIKGRYPFDARSQTEVNLRDFGTIFGAGGVIEQYFQENLAEFVDSTGRQWKWKNASLGIPQKALLKFQQAARIRDAFFNEGGQKPKVRFRLRPVDLDAGSSQVLLDIDGQLAPYRHGPLRTQELQWPGPKSTHEVRVVFEDTSHKREGMNFQGTWALFRLLDKVQKQMVSSDRLKIGIQIGQRKAAYEMRASSVVNPFAIRDLANFTCPERLW